LQQIANPTLCKVPLLWDATVETVPQPAEGEGWYADDMTAPPPAIQTEPVETAEAASGSSVATRLLLHLAMASGTGASARALVSGCRFAAMGGDRGLTGTTAQPSDLISSRRASTAACIKTRFVFSDPSQHTALVRQIVSFAVLVTRVRPGSPRGSAAPGG
jgi:hypothetical protein